MKTTVAVALLALAPLATPAQRPSISQPLVAASGPHIASGATPKSNLAPRPIQAAPQDSAAKQAPARIDPAKDALIRKLFEIQGTRKTMQEVITGISNNMKPTLVRSLPPGDYRDKLIDLFFERFQSKLKVDDLIEVSVPVYDKYFSKEDLAGLVQFYQTPLGQKVNSVLPKVLVETQAAAAGIGEELGRSSMMEVLAEHPDLAKALEDATSSKN